MNNSESTSSTDLKRQRTEPKSYGSGRKYDRNRSKKAKADSNSKEVIKRDDGNYVNMLCTSQGLNK